MKYSAYSNIFGSNAFIISSWNHMFFLKTVDKNVKNINYCSIFIFLEDRKGCGFTEYNTLQLKLFGKLKIKYNKTPSTSGPKRFGDKNKHLRSDFVPSFFRKDLCYNIKQRIEIKT